MQPGARLVMAILTVLRNVRFLHIFSMERGGGHPCDAFAAKERSAVSIASCVFAHARPLGSSEFHVHAGGAGRHSGRVPGAPAAFRPRQPGVSLRLPNYRASRSRTHAAPGTDMNYPAPQRPIPRRPFPLPFPGLSSSVCQSQPAPASICHRAVACGVRRADGSVLHVLQPEPSAVGHKVVHYGPQHLDSIWPCRPATRSLEFASARLALCL
ncbi:hypothetical protein BC628DRAFT_1051007 [Trametes gibbosa]|nr:hypothetical protein BC628DRAFT_1051007 [Trametes gibbosa]